MSVCSSGHESDPLSSELPELPLSKNPNYVTHRGRTQLRARLVDAEARLAGVADTDDDGRLQRNYLARHIRWLQSRLSDAILVDPADTPTPDRVAFGATVEVLDSKDRRSRYRLVGEDEADPGHGLISWASPLGRALFGARVGDTVIWVRPDGNLQLEVQNIQLI